MVPSPAGFHSKTYRLAAVEVIHRNPLFHFGQKSGFKWLLRWFSEKDIIRLIPSISLIA
jgi:hypothetical protein